MNREFKQGTESPVPPAEKPPRFLSAKEVAERYHLPMRWVYDCRSLPRLKIGRYLRFLESDLEIWERRQTGTGRVYPFHHSENTEVRTKLKGYQRELEKKAEGGEFVLQFDFE